MVNHDECSRQCRYAYSMGQNHVPVGPTREHIGRIWTSGSDAYGLCQTTVNEVAIADFAGMCVRWIKLLRKCALCQRGRSNRTKPARPVSGLFCRPAKSSHYSPSKSCTPPHILVNITRTWIWKTYACQIECLNCMYMHELSDT